MVNFDTGRSIPEPEDPPTTPGDPLPRKEKPGQTPNDPPPLKEEKPVRAPTYPTKEPLPTVE